MNVFQYGAITESNWIRNLEDMTDFRPKYTFYSDFSIAEYCEVFKRDANAVLSTYNNVKKSWGSNIESITEVCMVLNHKAFSFNQNVDSYYLKCGDEWRKKFVELYTKLYEDCVSFIREKFGEDEDAMSYFYQVTD